MERIERLHERALECAKRYLELERELIKLLQAIDLERGFRRLGFSSLYLYCTSALKLSESQAYALISVSRKSKEVPALQSAIEDGTLSVNKAKRITSVITNENSSTWIDKAAHLTQRELEKEIVKEHPKEAVREKMTYVQATRVQLVCGISEGLMKDLERIKDLVSQKSKKPCTLEDAISSMAELYLTKHDPVQKAERVLSKKKPFSRKVSNGKRKPIPARIKHEVMKRDRAQCVHKDKNNQRCEQRRWIDVHHIAGVADGGTNTLENLATLCKSHHALMHELQL